MYLLKEHGSKLELTITGEASLGTIKIICRQFESDVAETLIKMLFSLGVDPEFSLPGWTLGLEYIQSPSEQLSDYIKCLKKEDETPQPLSWFARRTIRKCLGGQGIKQKILEGLPLPEPLKEFLLYSDIPL